jgi:hypothetical protein
MVRVSPAILLYFKVSLAGEFIFGIIKVCGARGIVVG